MPLNVLARCVASTIVGPDPLRTVKADEDAKQVCLFLKFRDDHQVEAGQMVVSFLLLFEIQKSHVTFCSKCCNLTGVINLVVKFCFLGYGDVGPS